MNPNLDDALIAKVFKLFEDEESDHQTVGFGWTAGCRIEWTKAVFKDLTWDGLGQPQEVVSRIELINLIWAE